MEQCKLKDKAEWIKFLVKNLYEWPKQREILQKKVTVSMKVTCMKTKELIEKATKAKKWITSKWTPNNFGGNISWNHKPSSYLITSKENMTEIL